MIQTMIFHFTAYIPKKPIFYVQYVHTSLVSTSLLRNIKSIQGLEESRNEEKWIFT